jgi:hypothetical protein
VWGALGNAYLVLAFQQAAVTERASYGPTESPDTSS